MSYHDPDAINRLIGEFYDLFERWEAQPDTFDWERLAALARSGAHAYNEDAGPSFQALALDGVEHTEFHERFLSYLLHAGFDPFRLAKPGTGVAPVPVIDHASLADAALSNPYSARMRASLMEITRHRFAPLAREVQTTGKLPPEWYDTVEACAESIPLDLLETIDPELARPHRSTSRRQSVNPVEGYLTSAEALAENISRPYG